ncbi:MAG TPA: beta-ketoacyl-ACP synthase III [Vicinamibacteria bacterium]|jgi:3-oxoacyl-[acyl-carrier-protein] synthase-3|nr:beta-ketoacyl-ACP synthase III [Vicinamibacteria bacterium]
MPRKRARISSLGRYVPERILTNADLEKIVDTSDEWIRTRTGIEQRHVADPGTPTSELAAHAARDALRRRGVGPETVDLIIIATVTPDMAFPSTACIVQDKLKATRAWGFDISAACSGFLYALTMGCQFIETGAHRRVMVIGADVMSSIIDYKDRSTCVLFGDGAGAVLLEPAEDETGIFDFFHEVDGSGGCYLNMPAGGSARPATHETVELRQHFLRQEGAHVFKYAVRKFAEASRALLDRNGLGIEQVDLFVAHQANIRIIDAVTERLGLPEKKVVKNIARFGNTTAATIPLALGSALDQERLKHGDLVLLAAVGAGFTVGAVLDRWSAL